jgi:hypothetical protein
MKVDELTYGESVKAIMPGLLTMADNMNPQRTAHATFP